MDLCLLLVRAKAFGGFTPSNCSNRHIKPVENGKCAEDYQ